MNGPGLGQSLVRGLPDCSHRVEVLGEGSSSAYSQSELLFQSAERNHVPKRRPFQFSQRTCHEFGISKTKLERLAGSRPSPILLAVGPASWSKVSESSAESFLPTLRDITAQAALDLTIVCGDHITGSLLDVNGQGACFLDFDNDGWLDLYTANGSSRSLDLAGKSPRTCFLRDPGSGTFAQNTESAGPGDTIGSSGCAVGHCDNDGDPDLYLTNYGPNGLYRNDCGRFRDVSGEFGVSGPEWSHPK